MRKKQPNEIFPWMTQISADVSPWKKGAQGVRGLTLVEMVFVLVIGSMVAGVAFNLWKHSSREISRSTVRQILQQQIRQAADIIAADFRSIKDGTLVSGDDAGTKGTAAAKPSESFLFEFQRFIIASGSRSAINATERVAYEKMGTLLRRRSFVQGRGARVKILATDLVGLEISVDADQVTSTNGNEPGSSPKDTSRVALVLTGQKMVPGTTILETHIERTTLVMRDAYYRRQHLGARTTSELAASAAEDLNASEAEKSALFKEKLTTADFEGMDPRELQDLLETQTENQQMQMDSLKTINDQINGVAVAKGWSDTIWDAITFDRNKYSFSRKIQDVQGAIANKDQATDLEGLKGDIETANKLAESKETEFLQRSVPAGEFSSAAQNPKDLDLLKKAVEMKIQDWQRAEAKKQKEIQSGGIKDPGEKKDTGDDCAINQFRPEALEAGRGKSETNEAFQKRREESQRLVALYDKVDIQAITVGGNYDATRVEKGKKDLLGAFSVTEASRSNDYKAYEAAKNISMYGSTKIGILQSLKDTQENIRVVDAAIKAKGQTGKSR